MEHKIIGIIICGIGGAILGLTSKNMWMLILGILLTNLGTNLWKG